MTNAAEQLRRHAAELMELADEIERRAAFPRLLNAAWARRMMNIKRAADASGLSERTLYRLAPVLGARVNGRWKIDEAKLLEAMARRGEAMANDMANDGEQTCFVAAANHGSLQRKDKA